MEVHIEGRERRGWRGRGSWGEPNVVMGREGNVIVEGRRCGVCCVLCEVSESVLPLERCKSWMQLGNKYLGFFSGGQLSSN